MEKGGFPAGAVVVIDREVITKGITIGNKLHDPTSHSETAAIREACKKLQSNDLSGATLYSSLEPCVMCFSVVYWAGISKIVYAARKTKEMVKKGYYEGEMNIEKLNMKNNSKIELQQLGDFAEESLEVVEKWEVKLL